MNFVIEFGYWCCNGKRFHRWNHQERISFNLYIRESKNKISKLWKV